MAEITFFKPATATFRPTFVQRLLDRFAQARTRRRDLKRMAEYQDLDPRFAQDIGLSSDQILSGCLEAQWREHFPR